MAKTESHTTTDHEEIRRWAEARGARPAHVRGTGDGDDPGILRLYYPDSEQAHSGKDEALQELSWDEFFAKFDENKLAFLYQDHTADGKQSRFSKFVSR